MGSAGRPVRFGVVNETLSTPRAWRDLLHRADDAGVGTFVIRDHLGTDPFGPQLGPFAALAAAAETTRHIRLGTMVVTNDLRHPALVAQEAATIDWLSGGRFELGIGAGWQADEYARMGVPFDRAGERISRLEESLAILDQLLRGQTVSAAGAAYQMRDLRLPVAPVQRPRPPILVAGGGPRMLRLAGRTADIVGVLPAPIAGTAETEDPADRSPEAFDAKAAVVRDAAGERAAAVELSVFTTMIRTDRRREATEQLIQQHRWSGVSCEQVWEMPSVLIGNAAQLAEAALARRDRHGLTYFITSDDVVDDIEATVTQLPG
jgi:probable F420-dependent oxidoreductase